MARDKARDDEFFNCKQEHEDGYVAGLYGSDKNKVSTFLSNSCAAKTINYSTHKEVYNLIKEELGYSLPN